MRIEIASLNELSAAAKQFVAAMKHSTCFAFEGEMGAGKTTFITAILKEMGIKELKGSPTYGLVNQYISDSHGLINHFDAYRIESDEEAFQMGIEDLLNEGAICFIEWPSKVVRFLPDETVWIRITSELDGSRSVEFV